MNHHKRSTSRPVQKINYLSPADIIEKYPELEDKHNWNPEIVGSFLRCSLLKGYYDRARKTAMIEEKSVLDLIDYLNKKIESQKIRL
jgi:hypothetical protein